MKTHDTVIKGESCHKSTLTEEQVIEIRKRYAAGGVSQLDLSLGYGVKQSVVGLIVKGRTWKHVGGPRTSRGNGVKKKFKSDEVRDIRRRVASGVITKQDAADEYGVTIGAINKMVSRRTWAHLSD